MELKNNFTINWKLYDDYIAQYEEKLKSIHDYINKIYGTLNGSIMVQQKWCDDNAKAFVDWFKTNGSINNSDSYEAGYKIVKEIFEKTVKAVCNELKKSESNSYLKCPNVKKYANYSTAWDNLAKYKTTSIANTFPNVSVTGTAKADKASIKQMYDLINADTKTLKTLSAELAQLVLSFGVGNKGIMITGLDCPANARLISRIDIFSTNMKKQLDACITKTNGLEGIVKVVK